MTYGEGTTGSVQFEEQNGQITGVDGPDGQVLESNAQIEAQTKVNGEDRLNQGERPQEGQPGTGNNTPSDTPSDTPNTAASSAAGPGRVFNNPDNLTTALDPNRPVTVIGRTMSRVANAANQLSDAGFRVNTYQPQSLQPSLKANYLWLWRQNAQNIQFVNIGAPTTIVLPPSDYFQMEQQTLQNWRYPDVLW